MYVAIGCDHAGFVLKHAVETFLAAEPHDVVGVRTHSQTPLGNRSRRPMTVDRRPRRTLRTTATPR